jgi:hypothetical protein
MSIEQENKLKELEELAFRLNQLLNDKSGRMMYSWYVQLLKITEKIGKWEPS